MLINLLIIFRLEGHSKRRKTSILFCRNKGLLTLAFLGKPFLKYKFDIALTEKT